MKDFLAINESTLVEDTEVDCDLYIKSYVNGNPRYVLFSHGGEMFRGERRKQLIESNIKKLYVYAKSYKTFNDYQEQNLKKILSDKGKSSREKSTIVYSVAKNLTQELLNDSKSGVKVERVSSWVENTVDYILHDEKAFSNLTRVTAHDYQTYTHSVNLSVLGLLFGKHLGLGPDSLSSLGTGMILHDIGKIEVPANILNKSGSLTSDEFEIVKRHPVTAVNFLSKEDNISEKSLNILLQHHENYDGTGYPNGIAGEEIHLFGRAARIIDVYDAITSNRAYRNALKPFSALVEMKNTMKNCFDVELFKEFICFLGNSPHK
ncbi:metal dependent phosphohydrolase [Candidatus Scalindua japonica]|uniref:Metal dependent phosphohydrolase n=1 Tax=Candidatus Scalindua japonica TaxID=1284222 RepID=A0A286TZ26_9BACT|nr:HD domain-containing phosphohydrolase [Candidatus Scalindua japonica]GAX61126.1 metal dependent phosphohydrolase [Candidatus Scalindua japonica]